ncbi:LysR family transcriptional regulator [Streptomyces sp. SID8361]|uniref:LysR family transcriptional regulator n=1 Tax=Streptomyces sp. MnatMP-M27 TaxID=1839768 RepID=UPI00081F5525|nr:LysR family transcriptional regulator [Streptomyces sp. MnatMP-M27]MYU10904.1 LysR family transcriptional regulator [Streptomyces sp. SID8361]SCF76381.1 DNA-binding transcriptional regulator, LysR family [Streptomyces sp. MnatMP-M27]
MEIRDLEYFLCCCETGSFTAAARKTHIVQSAMSSAIARLERDLGTPLFDRSVTPVALTEHGAALRAAAQRVLEAVRTARDEVHAVSGRVRGTVVLGSTFSTGPLDLAVVLTDMRSRHPEVVVQLRQSSTGSAGNLRGVLDGSLDIALTASSKPPPDGIVLRPLVEEPLVFVCCADHPLAERELITLPDLSAVPMLRFPPGWGMRDTVDRVLGPVDSATEVADYALMVKLIGAGFGVTLMPASAVTGDGVCVIPLDVPELTWHLSAAVSARRRPTAAAEALLEALTAAAHDATGPRRT